MAYFNYRNLDAAEFEALAKDVMERILGCRLFRYGQGKDGGIDLCDDIREKHIVVQCKRYPQGSFDYLYSVLKREEKSKIDKLDPRPEKYYIFTSLELLPQQKQKILDLFQEYMEGESCIVDGIAINDFFRDEQNHDLISRNIKLFLSFPENYQYSPADLSQIEANRLYDQLFSIFENDRKNHPSIRMMDPDPLLFPMGLPEVLSDGRFAVEKEEAPQPIKDMILDSWKREDYRHILLIGEGGIGKTVAMLTLPVEDWFKELEIPVIYVPLQKLDAFKGDLNRYIREKIGSDNYERCIELSNSSPEGQPRLLLLLDGFNEIPDEYKKDAAKYIREWMERPGIQIITTSRLGFFLENSFSKYRLQPLPYDTVRSFLLSAGIKEEQLPRQSDRIWVVINIPLMLTMYLQIEKTVETIRRSPSASILEWKKPDNAGHIIWDYLQMELYRCIQRDDTVHSAVHYATAILAIAPYVCCQMSRRNKFYITREIFHKLIREALAFYASHQDLLGSQILKVRDELAPYNQEKLLREENADRYERILVDNIALFQAQIIGPEKEVLSLMHKNFRDALAAFFICSCLSRTPDVNEKKALLDQADYYVKAYMVEYFSDEELVSVWERHRKEEPEDGQITFILLDLIGRQRDYDYRELDFSGLDLTNTNIHSLLSRRLDICPLPSDSKRFERTKISLDCLTPTGHAGRVRRIAFSPDGRHLTSGSSDRTVRIWDLESGESRVLEGHAGGVNSVAFSPDGRHLASGSSDRTVRIWDLESREGRVLEGHAGGVNSIAFSPDGRQLASGSSDGTVRVWDLASGESRVLRGHAGGVNSVAFSPDGRYLASGSSDRTVRIWDLESGESRVLEGHAGGVNSIAFSPDGRQLASGSSDRTLRVWDLASGESLVLRGHAGGVNSVAFSPDGRYFASGSSDRTVRIWDIENGESRVLRGHADWIRSVAFSPDGMRLASGSSDRTVRIWDIETFRELWKDIFIPSINLRGANFELAIIDEKDSEILKSAGVILPSRFINAEYDEMDSTSVFHIGNQIMKFFEQEPHKYCHVDDFLNFLRENDTDDMRKFISAEMHFLFHISEIDNAILPVHQDPVLQQILYQIWMIDTQRLKLQEFVTEPIIAEVSLRDSRPPQGERGQRDNEMPPEEQKGKQVESWEVIEEATKLVLRSFQEWFEKKLKEDGKKYRIIQSAERQSPGDQNGYDVGLEMQIGDATYKVSFECKDYTSNIKEGGKNKNTTIRSYAGNLLKYFINSESGVNNRWVLVNRYGNLQNDYPAKLFETWNILHNHMRIFAITETASSPTCKEFFSVNESAYQMVYPGSAPIQNIDDNREKIFAYIANTVIGGDYVSGDIKKKLKQNSLPNKFQCKQSSDFLSVRTKDGDDALEEVLKYLTEIQRDTESNSKINGIYIIGEYGTGKTWLLYRIIVEIISHSAKYPYIPVLMQLREFFMDVNELSESNIGENEIRDIVGRYVDRVLEQHDQLEENFMLNMSPVFLLDGFDEVLSGLSATNNKIKILLAIRDELNSRYRSDHPVYIVTSRESDFHACQTNKEFIELFKRFYKITLEDCPVNEAKESIIKYAENAGIPRESVAGLVENPNVMGLARRAVFHALILQLIDSKESSLEGVVDEFSLLNLAIDSEIRRTIKEVRNVKEKTTDDIAELRQDLLEALLDCAIYCTKNNGNEAPISFSKEELNEIIPSGIVLVKNKAVESATPEKPWTFTINQNNDRRVSFIHNIVREFLVAKKFFLLIQKCVSGEMQEQVFFNLLLSVQMSPASLQFLRIFIQNAQQEKRIKEKLIQWLCRSDIKKEASGLPARLLELLLQPDCIFGGSENEQLDLSGIHADNLCIWNCSLQHLNFSNACLRNMQMTDIRLFDVDLRGADLSGLRLAPSKPIIDICHWRQNEEWHLAVLYQNGQVLKYSFTDRFMQDSYSITLLRQFEGATCLFSINGILYVVISGKIIYPLEGEHESTTALYDMRSDNLIRRIVSEKEMNSILVQNGIGYLNQVIFDNSLISQSLDITESDRYFLTKNGMLILVSGGSLKLISQTGAPRILIKWETTYECFTIDQRCNGENHIYIKAGDCLIKSTCDKQFAQKSAPVDYQIEGICGTMQAIRAIKEDVLVGVSESDLYIVTLKTNKAIVEKVNTAVKASRVKLSNDDGSRQMQNQEAFALIKGSMIPFDDINAFEP